MVCCRLSFLQEHPESGRCSLFPLCGGPAELCGSQIRGEPGRGEAFSQADLDLTINRLRDRQLVKWGEKTGKKMPSVTLSGDGLMVNGVRINDPARDPEVAPVLWEIRRERRVELILEGRRGEDLRRWAKYEYLNSGTPEGYPSKTFLGAYLALADYPGMKATDEKENRCWCCLTRRILRTSIPKKGISIISVIRRPAFSRRRTGFRALLLAGGSGISDWSVQG